MRVAKCGSGTRGGSRRTSAAGADERLSEPEEGERASEQDVVLILALPARVPAGLVSFNETASEEFPPVFHFLLRCHREQSRRHFINIPLQPPATPDEFSSSVELESSRKHSGQIKVVTT